MGTSTSFEGFGNKLERLAGDLKDSRRPMTIIAIDAKRIMQGTAVGVIGHKVAGKRRAISVGYTIRGQGVRATAIVGYRGPAHLVNNATSAHTIYPRRRAGVRTRRRGASVLKITHGDGGFAAFAPHPGTKGKHFFEAARFVIVRETPGKYGRLAVTEPLAKIFH